ncbi:MAG: hypothetical protein V1707_00175 [bacterium]
MIIDWLLVIITVICFGIAYWVARKKLPLAAHATMDEEAERQAGAKRQLLEQRFERSAKESVRTIVKGRKEVKRKVKEMLKPWYLKLVELEERTRQEVAVTDVQEEAELSLLEQAFVYLKQREWGKAEEIFLEVLQEDLRNPLAYEGLARVYEGQRDMVKALETWRYALRLFQSLSTDDLGEYGLDERARGEKARMIQEKIN